MPHTVAPVVPPDTLTNRAQPVLRADGLHLRPWLDSDAEGVRRAFTDPEIQQWHLRRIDDHAEALDWIRTWRHRWEAGRDASWAIATDPAGEAMGYVALRCALAEGTAEVSYWVAPAGRGRSAAARAVSALSDWAFDVLGLHRLWLMHSTANSRSCAVAIRAGFGPEGILRDHLLHTDGWHDMHVHGRLNTER